MAIQKNSAAPLRQLARQPQQPQPPPAPPPEEHELDALFTAAYEQLHRLAASIRRNDVHATISPTALVNEAWLRLANSQGAAQSPLHFKRIAARAMRQILIEAARRRIAQKRGGGSGTFVSLGDASEGVPACEQELLAVDAALKELARLSPRQAAVVECRFFGGLDVAETAKVLQLSEATILRDWRAAKAWLAREIRNTWR